MHGQIICCVELSPLMETLFCFFAIQAHYFFILLSACQPLGRSGRASSSSHAGCFIGVSKRKLDNICGPSCCELASDHVLKKLFGGMRRRRASAASMWRVPERKVLILRAALGLSAKACGRTHRPRASSAPVQVAFEARASPRPYSYWA